MDQKETDVRKFYDAVDRKLREFGCRSVIIGGTLTMQEYTDFLAYLETVHPLMRKDILSRLEKANALAANARRGQMLAAQIKNPSPPPRSTKDEDSLPPF